MICENLQQSGTNTAETEIASADQIADEIGAYCRRHELNGLVFLSPIRRQIIAFKAFDSIDLWHSVPCLVMMDGRDLT
jgi:hypothetical protein